MRAQVVTIFSSFVFLIHSSPAQTTDLEDRVAELEKRVAELEGALGKGDKSVSEIASDETVLFSDGFEKGLSNWTTAEFKSGKWIDADGGNVGEFSSWRATAEVTTEQKKTKAASGDRFATTARQQDGLSVIFPENKNWTGWYGHRFLVTKEPIDLKGTSFPVLTLSIILDYFTNQGTKNSAMVGYLREGEGIADFQALMTVEQAISEWTTFEIDCSSIPKDTPVHLAIVYKTPNSKALSTSGLQIDDVLFTDQ
ncbi:MAG: hypothetical protein AAF558_00130 [Verrucomicrobiota bacterium]